mgnify:CR=1 FL=1
MREINVKKLLLLNLPYLFIGLYAGKIWQAWRLAAGENARALFSFTALQCARYLPIASLNVLPVNLLLLTIKPVYLLIKEKKWREIAVYLVMGGIVLTPWAVRTILFRFIIMFF